MATRKCSIQRLNIYRRRRLSLAKLCLVAVVSCFGRCQASSKISVQTTVDSSSWSSNDGIVLGFAERLYPDPSQDIRFPAHARLGMVANGVGVDEVVDVSSAHQAVIQHPQRGEDNRTLLWRNYTAVSGYTGPMSDKFLSEISLVWLRANPPSARAHRIMAYLYILMMLVGFSGNAFVLFMFWKCRSLRTPANTLVMNLVFSDWLMMLKIPIIIHNSFHNGPQLGSWGCQVYGFVGAFSGTLSICTLTSIAIDRFNVIVYPLNPNRSTTHMKARLTILFCWLYALFFSAVPLLHIYSSYVPEGFLTCCSFDYLTEDRDARIFMFCYFVCAWCVPFLTIAYCYSHILHVVRGSAHGIKSNKDKTKQELKLAAVVFSVIALWFVAWTPYAIVALLGISHNEHLLTPLGSMLPAFCAKGAALINPYVYAVTHPRFRMEFNRIFLKKSCPRPANFNTSVQTRGVAETNLDDVRGRIDMEMSVDESMAMY